MTTLPPKQPPKLQLQAAPTFRATVAIPLHGNAEPAQIEFVFKHMSQSCLHDYVSAPEAKTRTDAQTLSDILMDWPGVEAAFTPENLQTFTDQYAGAARAIFEAYVTLLAQIRLKN